MTNQSMATRMINRSRHVLCGARGVGSRVPQILVAVIAASVLGGCVTGPSSLEKVRAQNEKLVARLGTLESSGLEIRQADDRVMIVIPGLFFDFGESKLSASARVALAQATALLKGADYGQHGIEIEGYTDSVGGDDYNLALSEKRARAVEEELLFSALKSDRILDVRGMGEANPLQPNTQSDGSDNPDGRAKNRRVEIVIIDPRMTAGN